MRKLILILLCVAGSLIAQDNKQSQSIELPDFVITGIQNITVPEMIKKKPPLINSLSEEFFRPSILPEQLNLANASAPLLKDYKILGLTEYSNGLLKLGGGLHTLPTGHFYFNQSLSHILFNSHVWGNNTTEYIKNAGYNISGAELSTDFFISSRSGFLPGLKISMDGLFYRDSYKLFASSITDNKRENENIETSLALTNDMSENFKYGIIGEYSSLKFKRRDFIENIFKGGAYLRSNFGKFGFNLAGEYQIQDPKNSLTIEDSYSFYNGTFGLQVRAFETFKVEFGLYYAKQDTSKLFSPTFSFNLMLDDNLSMSGGYSSYYSFNRTRDLLALNRYYIPGAVDNILTEVNSKVDLAIKYEFYTNFELSVGANFSSIDNFAYFDDSLEKGVHNISTLDEVKNAKAYLYLALLNGPVGSFYGDLNYHYTKTKDALVVPYSQSISGMFTYAVEIAERLGLKGSISYFSKSYADIQNNVALDSFIDLSFIVKYKFIGNMKITAEVNNILNRDNARFLGYSNKPMDIIAGIEYRW